MGATQVNEFARPFGRRFELKRELKVAEQLALEAGELLRFRQRGDLEIRYKANGEIVTPSDLAANEIICHGLAAAFDDDSICSEEAWAAAMLAKQDRVWIVDPLDSTSNYVQRGDEYCVSIGLAIGGKATLGVVYNPARNELFSGFLGHGACCNGVTVRTSSAVSTDRPSWLISSKEWKRGLEHAMTTLTVQPMASMAYKLARVAAGREDAVLSLKQRKPWGTCAGAALVEAAEGRVTALDGQPLVFDCVDLRTFDGLAAAGNGFHGSVLNLACGLRSSTKTPGSA